MLPNFGSPDCIRICWLDTPATILRVLSRSTWTRTVHSLRTVYLLRFFAFRDPLLNFSAWPVFFAGNGPGVAKLRRVLVAYSWRDPSIGYYQGMNLLAALLLLVYPDEEDAFWMLCSMLERVLPSDYYSSQLLVSQADQKVLQDLIQLALPDVSPLSAPYNPMERKG